MFDVPSALALERSESSASPRSIAWIDPEESFLQQAMRHMALIVATCGLYVFWARADARRSIHRAIHVAGRPLDYSGTGRESFISFIIALLTMIVTIEAIYLYAAPSLSASGAREIISIGGGQYRWHRLTISLPLLFLLGSVAYRKRQHILRRTWWGGERFDLSGHAWRYAWTHFWTAFLVPLTLGWAAPWRAHTLEKRKTNETFHGPRTFHAAHALRDLYKTFAVFWFGGVAIYLATVLSLGIAIGDHILAAVHTLSLKPLLATGVLTKGLMIVIAGLIPFSLLATAYQGAWLEHQMSGIACGDARLRLRLPKLPFVGYSIENAVLKVGTLGLLGGLADARMARFIVAHLSLEGSYGPFAGAPGDGPYDHVADAKVDAP
jgi:uncharacterized membrane protein YjgN (DUF898 family)